MTRRKADEVEAFLVEHDLPAELGEPLRRLLGRAVAKMPTILQTATSAGSLPTLMLPGDDRKGPAQDTLPSLAGHVTADPSDAGAAMPGAMLVRIGLLGRGGMGEVHRARDAALNRMLAMKVLHERFQDDAKMRARFLAEAQVTAQLAHPSIPPVHAVGEVDGLPFFSMKEVHGRTLSEVIADVHSGGVTPWTVARLLEVFQKVGEAVAYAHARGVIHCDLKPSNVMVGSFGEVMVMDWGVARLVEPARSETVREAPVGLAWAAQGAASDGVAGTPAYMAPEQAMGDISSLGPPADVFALGVMLYEILCGRRPYVGNPTELVLQAVKGEVPAIEAPPGSGVDEGLEAIVHRAMRPKPHDRYPHAGALAADISRWREGSLRREKALSVVREAQAMLPSAAPKRERARLLRDLASQRLAQLGPAATAEEKSSAWALEEEAAALDREAHLRIVEATQKLHGALAHAPDLREAHELLARIHFEEHEDAERRRDADAAARAEVLLRAHDVGTYASYLAGVSALTVVTDPPCRARLFTFVQHGRELVPQLVRELGQTPLVDVELPVGSYLLELDARDRPVVRYPVVLRRNEPWTGRPPGGRDPLPVRLPTADELDPDDVYVPGGWFWFGGDPAAPGSYRGVRVWADAFVIRRDPVTTRELFRWLARTKDAQEARRTVLRAGGGVVHPEGPAVGVSWAAARAYAAWISTEDARWRLPTEVEWEKAARGVDGRWFPWGDLLDSAFAHVRTGAQNPLGTCTVSASVHDRSPYGVRGLAGNIRDWCADPWVAEAPASLEGSRGVQLADDEPVVGRRSVRGGSWRLPAEAARASARAGVQGDAGYPDVGFRLVRSY
jgi:formylglycine-generating enzyme required for sulfatase activity